VVVTGLALGACAGPTTAGTVSRSSTATITISHDQVLSADLHCDNLTIDAGVKLVTAGHNIYCAGVVDNKGTIVTGASAPGDFPLSYGGSGSGGTSRAGAVRTPGDATMAPGGNPCPYPGCPGAGGASAALPPLTGAVLADWWAAGMTLFLAGAGGGSSGSRKGGAGAYGLFVSAARIVAGTIEAEGADGTGTSGDYSGCGGGGTVILDYGTGGYEPGRYVVEGGHLGLTPSTRFAVGGSGHVAAVELFGGRAAHVTVVASPPTFATAAPATSSVITATFTGQDGGPVAGVPVTWLATSGTLSATSGVTDSRGQATVTLVESGKLPPSTPADPYLTAAVIATDADDGAVRGLTYVEGLSPVVSLLPSGRTARTWSWTAACPFNPAPCAPAGANPDVGWLQLNGELWNLALSAEGSAEMSLDASGALTSSTNLVYAPANSTDTWARGDPGPTYGVVLGYPGASPPESPSLRLPLLLDSIPPDLVATAGYDITPGTSTSFVFGYNLWLEPSRSAETVGPGTVEVLVSTDNSGAESLPAGTPVAATVPYAVDGRVSDGTDAWDVYVSGIGAGGQTAAGGGTVSFVLTSPLASGRVSIDFSGVLAAASRILESGYQWSGVGRSYWLDTIQLGSEVGPGGPSLASSGPASLSWTLADYCFGVRASLASAGC
jgi:hypothetical protein